RSDLGARVHKDLPGIDRGKKVTTEERHQRERSEHKSEETGCKHNTAAQRHLQKFAIDETDALKSRFKAALETHQWIARARQRTIQAMHIGVRRVLAQKIIRHGRDQCARQDEGTDHCGHYHFRHRYEKKARHTWQVEHRYEHDADTK